MEHYYKNISLINIEGEVWRDVVGYEGCYKVSNLGRVKRLSKKSRKSKNRILSEKMLAQSISQTGAYCKTLLTNDKKRSIFFVHRLVAFAFIEVDKNRKFVNHKNGDRNDNRVENLEWCTTSENGKHSFRELGRIHPKGMLGKSGILNKRNLSVNQLTLDGRFIKKWFSIKEAADKTGCWKNAIGFCCHGTQKTSGGFRWEFVNKNKVSY